LEAHDGGGEVSGDLVVQPAFTGFALFKPVDLHKVFVAVVAGGVHVVFVVGAFRDADNVPVKINIGIGTFCAVVGNAEFDADPFVSLDDHGVIGGGEDVINIR